eukprot:CAMPEP_0119302046 /NCGR_PEP_ID=MMETSP1333-20130426/3720_1 /TAXON_ID=418940 /ORGANISM="Scyphosphaera apsteinii, Strain RCC1455" /LENGTH=375 /DNA_ID=CAMNT_0007304283 /DNA_START=57 /DNA_END=1184 /DNA_ORIENTATION=+
MTATALIGSVHLILPAAIVLLPIPNKRAHRLYRFIIRGVACAWFTFAAALLESVVTVSVCGDNLVAYEDACVIISNHHCRIDWMFHWVLLARSRAAGSLKIALKEPLKAVPFFGWAMQAFLFVFLSRSKRASDLATIRSVLGYTLRISEPVRLVLFPEGTDLSPTNLHKSHQFSDANNLPRFQHVLQPRSAGFIECLTALGPKLDAVYDCTLSYLPNEADELAKERPSELSLVRGHFPRRVVLQLRRIPAAELSGLNSDDEVRDWLQARWVAKEKALEEQLVAARASHALPCTRQMMERPRRGLVLFDYTLASAGWTAAVCLLLWGLCNSIVLVAYTIGGCMLLAAVTRWAGGLDSIEIKMHELIHGSFTPLQAL